MIALVCLHMIPLGEEVVGIFFLIVLPEKTKKLSPKSDLVCLEIHVMSSRPGLVKVFFVWWRWFLVEGEQLKNHNLQVPLRR